MCRARKEPLGVIQCSISAPFTQITVNPSFDPTPDERAETSDHTGTL